MTNTADFITRWSASTGGEIANSQSFLKELCTLLDLPQPDPTQQDETANRYTFEKAVVFNNGDGTTSQSRIDLFRAGAFVLESKQGSERRAAEEAEALAKVTKRKKRRTGTATRGTPGWDQAMTRDRQPAKRYAEATVQVSTAILLLKPSLISCLGAERTTVQEFERSKSSTG